MDKKYTAVLWDPDTLRVHVKVTDCPRMAHLLVKPRKLNARLRHFYGEYPHVIYVTEGDITSTLESQIGHLRKKFYWKLEPEFIDAINQFPDLTHHHIESNCFKHWGSFIIDTDWINEKKILSRVAKHVEPWLQKCLSDKLFFDLMVRDRDGSPRRQ